MRRCAVFALAIALASTAAAEPPATRDDCLARVGRVGEAAQGQKLSDEMQARVEEEIGRARASCQALLFAEAERALQLALRLINGEVGPD